MDWMTDFKACSHFSVNAFHQSRAQNKVVFHVMLQFYSVTVFLWIFVKRLHVMNHTAVLSVYHLFHYSLQLFFQLSAVFF